MKSSPTPSRHIAEGTIRGLLAEALALPTGILIAALLTRNLGPGDYGLFALATALVLCAEWVIVSLFAGATVKLVSEAEQWRPVGAAALRLYAVAGGGGMLMLWVLASPIARLLNEPALAGLLYLFALDIPVFCLAHAHRGILIGTGGFNQRALASAARSVAKFLFIALPVGMGLSIRGAILGWIGASIVELMILRIYVRPAFLGRCDFPLRAFQSYATPLFLSTLSINLFERLDLFMLQWLGGSAELAGIYGAAQTLSAPPSILSVALAPLLLSSQSRMLHTGQESEAREMGREAMRAMVWLLPLAAIAAGAAPEITAWIYGESFLGAATPFGLLIFAQSALVMRSVIAAGLIAIGKPAWTSALTVPMVPLVIGGHLLLIPRLGPLGAALATTVVSWLSVFAAAFAVRRSLDFLPPTGTLLRSTLLSGLAYTAASWWPATGPFLLVKLPAIGLGVMLLFFFLGEFTARDLELVRELLRRPRTGEEISRGV